MRTSEKGAILSLVVCLLFVALSIDYQSEKSAIQQCVDIVNETHYVRGVCDNPSISIHDYARRMVAVYLSIPLIMFDVLGIDAILDVPIVRTPSYGLDPLEDAFRHLLRIFVQPLEHLRVASVTLAALLGVCDQLAAIGVFFCLNLMILQLPFFAVENWPSIFEERKFIRGRTANAVRTVQRSVQRA